MRGLIDFDFGVGVWCGRAQIRGVDRQWGDHHGDHICDERGPSAAGAGRESQNARPGGIDQPDQHAEEP